MIVRKALSKLELLLSYFPAVGIIGPRQCGKTTFARMLIKRFKNRKTMYLDLEYDDDLAKLTQPSLFLKQYQDHCIILDEIQRKPDLFPLLRSLIDQNRQPGRFIILGSASPDLIRDSSESLAGRISYYELTPFLINELGKDQDILHHWYRGGYPLSLLAPDDKLAFEWLNSFIKTYAERDLLMLGIDADPVLISRIWKMLASCHGGIWNANLLSKSLGVNVRTVNRYVNFMEQAFLVFRLQSFTTNLKKRIVKSPKLYIRDSGVLHSLNQISSYENLWGNVLSGASWEGYIIEQIHGNIENEFDLYFYRTHHGTECDLLLVKGNTPFAAIEIKLSSAPKVSKGFHIAIEDLKTKHNYIIAQVENDYPVSDNIRVVNIKSFILEHLPILIRNKSGKRSVSE